MRQINIWQAYDMISQTNVFYVYEGENHEARFDTNKRRELSDMEKLKDYFSGLPRDLRGRKTGFIIDSNYEDREGLKKIIEENFNNPEIDILNFRKSK